MTRYLTWHGLSRAMRGPLVWAALALSSAQATAQQATGPDCVVAAFYPPYMIADTATNAGMSIELIREAAARAGREIEVKFVPFPRTLVALNSDSDCIMPALFRNPSREGKYRWIVSYAAAQMRLSSLGAPANSLEDGRKLPSIAVETGASADQFLTNAGFENLVRLSNPESSARMLHAGRVTAWAQTKSVSSDMWRQLEFDAVLYAGDPVYSVPVYIAGRRAFPDDVAGAYKAAVDAMIADGSVQRILEAYD